MSDTPLVEIGGVSRRDVLQRAALLLLSGAPLQVAFAQHVHEQARQERESAGGVYTPKMLTAHEYKTVTRLAELIVPADGDNGSAVDAGAPEFIDLLCSQNEKMAEIYTGGLLWLDRYTNTEHGSDFAAANAAKQTAVLDALVAAGRAESRDSGDDDDDDAEKYDDAKDLTPGVRFFGWVRRMTVDAYYTSPIGIKDINYIGNQALTEYTVPEEAIAYVMRHKPS
jgi:Gluconate 2-dehydrogenase subunit 3